MSIFLIRSDFYQFLLKFLAKNPKQIKVAGSRIFRWTTPLLPATWYPWGRSCSWGFIDIYKADVCF